jgi:hypothetical protein
MKYINNYKDFNINEEGLFKNFLLSAALSIGLSNADAQTIQNDTAKMEVVNTISNFNKSNLINLYSKDETLNNLKKELSYKLNDPDVFIERYLKLEPNGILIRPDFIEGLELHLRRNRSFEIGYNIKLK